MYIFTQLNDVKNRKTLLVPFYFQNENLQINNMIVLKYCRTLIIYTVLYIQDTTSEQGKNTIEIYFPYVFHTLGNDLTLTYMYSTYAMVYGSMPIGLYCIASPH